MIEAATAIELNEDYCSRCRLCCSVCPFEAVSFDANADKVSIDIENCQFCGQCASTCPAHAIELAYYDEKLLIKHIEEEINTSGARTLVMMCRGSSPPSGEMWQILEKQNIKGFVPVRVPCVGRLSPEFYLEALSIGMNKIIAVQCDEKFCRFKRGSELNIRRVQLLKTLLEQLGYEKDTLVIIKNPLQAVYDTEKCVGCDKCEFICPYDAIEAQPLATPQIDYGLCKGCGACALVCPHSAIQLNGFEYEHLSQTIQGHRVEAKRLRARGVSPIILVFCCQWAEFSALDNAKDNSATENAMIVEIPCFNSLDPVHILDALLSGFDGVLAVICRDEDCKLEEGRGITEGNILALEGMLHKLNLKGRFEVFKTSPRYMGSFGSKLNSFISKISSLSTLD
ncbi:MAG: hydrogenase iron-sulfur subunit [Dehalococcoidia bacterium]|nr:hydrogenase iron-sulfur subunit [Dehalococcoidia bacterium]